MDRGCGLCRHNRRRAGAGAERAPAVLAKGCAIDGRDFQNNGFFPGDFAAHPPSTWIGAAGIFGFTPSGGSHFGPIYCTRRYRSHNPSPGYFQGDDGVWYRCQR